MLNFRDWFEGQLGDNFKDCIEYAQPLSEIKRGAIK